MEIGINNHKQYVDVVTQKGPKSSELLPYEKKDGHAYDVPILLLVWVKFLSYRKKDGYMFPKEGWACSMHTILLLVWQKVLKVLSRFQKSVSYQKKDRHDMTPAHPSFDMTTTLGLGTFSHDMAHQYVADSLFGTKQKLPTFYRNLLRKLARCWILN